MRDKSEQAMRRIFEAAECRTQTDLANLLKIRQSSISDAKKRDAVPPEWLIKMLRIKGINPDWILTGTGPKLLGPISKRERSIVYLTKTRPPEECSTQELMNELVRRALLEQ